jgi:ABC-type cobalamin transport system permease subunit
MRFDNVWRLSTAQALAVASVGGAAASSSAFGTQTYAIQLAYPGSTSSTGGCRIAIVSPNDNAVSSTQGTLLPPNWVNVVRCSPGQRVSAISNDAGTFSLSITELTD